jgi:formamidopyrimidine-DNA glycosylase
MPELPEVETVVRSLAPRLPGRTIVSVELRSKWVTPGNRARVAERLAGRRIEAIRRHGKFIVVTLDVGLLIVHLGMTGRLLLDAPEGPYSHGVFHLDHGRLVFDDPRQFGKIEYAATLPKRVAELGPDPLEVPLDVFLAALKRRRTRIKPLLLNQKFLRGVGNIYADESLFRARIHPRTLASRLSKARASELYTAMREILTLAI